VNLIADTVLVQDSEPIPATVDEEVVVLSLRAGAYFGFGRIGSEIWAMLAKPRRVGAICDELAQQYDVDADTLTRDVTNFLQMLIERRLLRIVEVKSAP
jgi:coenzyme PQQ synthesis protein D (PqqD)